MLTKVALFTWMVWLLPVPGGPWINHSALVCHDRGDRPLLAGVGVEDQEFVIGWNQVEFFRIGIALLRAGALLALLSPAIAAITSCTGSSFARSWRSFTIAIFWNAKFPRLKSDLEPPCVDHSALDFPA
jgi:hypothetical protein